VRTSLLLAATFLVACGDATGSSELASTEIWSPAPVRDGNLRVATFNIRNYPFFPVADGQEAVVPKSYLRETDREALLAVLETLAFDLLAVQEICDAAAFEALLGELEARTGRTYDFVLSDNAAGNPQHVGLVVDEGKLRIDTVGEHEEINVTGTLRPGLSARIRSLGEGGLDLGVMSLHLASGDSNKRAALRATQIAAAAGVVAAQQIESADADYLLLGDLNTADGAAELIGLDASLAPAAAAHQPNATGCSSYYLKKSTNPLARPSWIDHVFRAALEEMDPEVPIESGAHCAVHRCEAFESRDASSGGTFFSVSDHCPVYFEVRDQDVD
jgi:endonuclease/exonuclease/phosphatase family metal-dependent hydrolase